MYVTRTLSIVPRICHFNQTVHTLVLDLESFSANEEYWNISLKADVSVSLIALHGQEKSTIMILIEGAIWFG